MKPPRILRATNGSSAIEFALTVPIMLAIVIGIAQFSLLLWTQFGLQHGAEMAARCASINTTTCASVDTIQSYAVTQAYGLSLPPTTFTVATPACGNQVAANYAFQFFTPFLGTPTVNLTAQACFPK
jgi:Flp pilus assembly protein TadG